MELVRCLIDILMNEAFECRTISGVFSFNHRSNSSCRLLESRFNGGFGNATLLLIGHKAGLELVNWFHNASVEECLLCSDDVPPPPDGWSCHVDVFHGDVFSAIGGRFDLPNGART